MIEAFKLLGRIVLDGGQAVLRELTGIGKEADKTGGNMQQMGQQTSQAGTQAAKAINDAGQSARTTSGAMGATSQAAQTMGQTINNAGNIAQQSLGRLPKELRLMARGLGEMDAATRTAFNAMATMYTDQRTKMQGFNRDQMQNKMGWIQLTAEAKNYQGTTAQFMAQVVALGAKEKAINDARMKANQMGLMGIIQQVGAMANLSTQASKISAVYTAMNNPLLNVNQTGLAIANTLNRMAIAGGAAAIALRQLGPSANFKDLQDRIALITAGIMRMQLTALAAGVVFVGFTAAMAKAALGPDPAKTRNAMAEIKGEYDKALTDRQTELYQWASIFEKVEIKVPSSQSMLNALADQVRIFKEWTTNLHTLTQRGVDQGFIAELQKMGPKAAGEVQGMVNMTAPQLDAYVALWREKHFQAATQAERELEGLRLATNAKIAELANSLTPLGLSFERFKGVWATALQPFVEIWGQIAAKVVDVGTKFGEFVNKLNETSPWITKIGGMFVYLVSALTLILAPLAAGIGLFGGLAAAWGALWPLIAPIVTGLGAMSGTVLLVSAGIVALVAVVALIVKALIDWNAKTGVMTEAWNQGMSTIKATASKFIEPLKEMFNAVMTKIKEVVGGMLSEATAFWQEHGTQVMAAVNNFSNMCLAVWNFLMPAIKYLVQTVIGGIISIFKGFFDTVMGLVKVFTGLFTGDWKLVWEGVKQIIWGVIEVIWGWLNLSFFGKIIKGAATFFKGMIAAFKSGWETIRLSVMYFVDGVKLLITNLKNGFTTTFTTMRNTGLSIWQSIRAGIEVVIQAIKQKIVTWATAIWNTIKTRFTEVKTVTTTIWNAIKSFFMAIFNFYKTIFTTAFNFYKTLITTVFNAIKSVIMVIWNFLKSMFIKSFNEWKTLFTTSFNAIKNTITTIFTSVKAFFSTVWLFIKTLFVNTIRAIVQNVTSSFTNIKTTITTIFNAVKNFITTTWTTIKTNVVNAATTLKNNVVTAFENIKSRATTIFNNVKNAVTGPIKTAMDTVGGYISKIKGFFTNLRLTIPKPKVPKIDLKWSSKEFFGKQIKYPTGFDVRWAAKGGILNRAQLIGAGEAGREMLMPLEGKYFKPVAAMIAEQMGALKTGGMSGTGARIEVPLVINGREIARAIVPNLDKEIERQRVLRRRGI
jgi:phage-related protein